MKANTTKMICRKMKPDLLTSSTKMFVDRSSAVAGAAQGSRWMSHEGWVVFSFSRYVARIGLTDDGGWWIAAAHYTERRLMVVWLGSAGERDDM